MCVKKSIHSMVMVVTVLFVSRYVASRAAADKMISLVEKCVAPLIVSVFVYLYACMYVRKYVCVRRHPISFHWRTNAAYVYLNAFASTGRAPTSISWSLLVDDCSRITQSKLLTRIDACDVMFYTHSAWAGIDIGRGRL